MPNGRPEEFDEDMASPLCDLSSVSACPPNDALFTYADININNLSETLGIPWEVSKSIPFGSVVPYSVSFGTLMRVPWQSQKRKRSSTSTQLRSGRRSPHMPWQRYKGYMVSYSTSPWSYLLGVHTLPAWKPCFQDSITVLSCHIPHPATRPMTSNGGPSALVPLPYPGTSRDRFPSQTSTPSQTPAQVSASALRLATSGVPGTCYQAGKPMDKISAGLKLSDSNSSPVLSYHPAAAALTSRFTETTKEWSKDGGKVAAETDKQTPSSGVFTPSLRIENAPSTRDMSPARKTQPTSLPEASTHILHIFCPTYPSPQSYSTSSPTSTLSSPLQILARAPLQTPYQNPAVSSLRTNAHQSTLSLTVGGRSFSPVPPGTPLMECSTTNFIIGEAYTASTIPQKPHAPSLFPSSALPSKPKVAFMAPFSTSHSTHSTIVRRRLKAHRGCHGACMGAQHTHNIRRWPTKLHSIL